MTAPCIVWFRDDLRLSDHPALHAASRTGAPVICLYVLDEGRRGGPQPPGGAVRADEVLDRLGAPADRHERRRRAAL